jgi:hypothetical protein
VANDVFRQSKKGGDASSAGIHRRFDGIHRRFDGIHRGFVGIHRGFERIEL